MQLWILHVAHARGDSYWAFDSLEKARTRLEDWVRQAWDLAPNPPRPPALSGEDLVEGFFDQPLVVDFYNLTEVALNGV